MAKSTQKDHRKVFNQLQQFSSHDVNELFHTAHEQVFQEINCLNCANCCSTTPALITERDAKRIAKHLKISISNFYSTFIIKDDDGDQVFKKTPCVFLGIDNFCSIYEVRPEACREYPHTDYPKMKQILEITFKNREVCPAVYDIVEGLKNSLD